MRTSLYFVRTRLYSKVSYNIGENGRHVVKCGVLLEFPQKKHRE